MGLQNLQYQKKFLNREEMLRHLQEFRLEIKPTVGVWSLTPSGGRFHEPYGAEVSIPERIKMIGEMAEIGVRGLEAHYGPEINEDNLHLYKQLEKDTGIRISGIGPHTFYNREYEFGTLSNPVARYRDRATEKLIRVLRLVKEADADACGLWPGIDGYTYPYGHLYYQMWENFEGALADAMDEVPGVMVRIETKPYEPIPNNIYRTISDGLILARDVEARLSNPVNRRLLEQGYCLVGMQPEIGHIRMGYEDTPCAFARICREGRMSHPHFNSQPLGNYDQDLNVGVVEWDQAEAGLLALKMAGFREYIGIDINPERMPIRKAMEINIRVLEIMNERINNLPYERMLDCYYSPEKNRGEMELILAEGMRIGR
ncbi:MAG: xylose isomerase [Firmicutes bacterium]|jgi:xylose isomerase|nr:xylose isomerase [Bacillota bacterium]